MHQGTGELTKTLEGLNALGRLRVWAAAHDLRLYQVADQLGVHQSVLSFILSGRREASPDIAAKVARLTGGYVQLRNDLVEHVSNDSRASVAPKQRARREAA